MAIDALQAEMILALEQLDADRVNQISLKDSSISELRDVVEQLTSDPGMVSTV